MITKAIYKHSAGLRRQFSTRAGPLQSVIAYGQDHHFPLENIPFGVIQDSEGKLTCCTKIGNNVIDLAKLFPLLNGPLFSNLESNIFEGQNLERFMKLGVDYRKEARQSIQAIFKKGTDYKIPDEAVLDEASCKMALPFFSGAFTDFSCSIHHARHLVMFKGGKDLQPNWVHMPVAYHSRATTVLNDGGEVRRPKGQLCDDGVTPYWGTCDQLDYELEIAAVIGQSNPIGTPIKVTDVPKHVFGYVLLNDWSSRDIMNWEKVPLGPFLGKNFATSISPWVTTPEALEPFQTRVPDQNPPVLEYLQDPTMATYDIKMEASIQTPKMGNDWHVLSRSNMQNLYYSFNQMIAHHAVSGCKLATGDLMGSGTVSGPEDHAFCSMVEKINDPPFVLPTGEKRNFLADGDKVKLSGYAEGDGYVIGMGDVTGTIIPALDDSHYF